MSEYPFESVRAMENLLLTGQRANYSGINIIFPHGGGAMPFLATRIAGIASLGSQVGVTDGLGAAESLVQFRGYLFDTASTTSAAQLLALREFYGGDISKIVVGTDCKSDRPGLDFLFGASPTMSHRHRALTVIPDPYVPQAQAETALGTIPANGNFTAAEMALINGHNALGVFPGVATKLGLLN